MVAKEEWKFKDEANPPGRGLDFSGTRLSAVRRIDNRTVFS
jgi:hypothetical protein